jgi:hypothetical protein
MKRLTPTYAVLFMRNTAWAITLNGPVMPLYVRSLGVDIVYWGARAARGGNPDRQSSPSTAPT